MSIEIRYATEDDIHQWDQFVARSPHGNLFHQYAALEIQAKHSNSELYPLIGFKGQEVVGLFPLFKISKGPIQTVFSPPPELRVAYLGPVLLNMDHMKQRKRESRHHEFIDGCFEWIQNEIRSQYTHIRLDGAYEDLRAFTWNDFTISPSYTYHVDLTGGEEEVLMNFSSDARANIRNAPADSFTIEEGGLDEIELIIEQVTGRYEDQGVSFRTTAEFVKELYTTLPEGQIRPYALRVDGDFVGGILVTDYKDMVSRWHGGVRTDIDVDIAVNDLLDWQVMSDAIERGRTTYDLVGADNRRINRYKSKFNPSLHPFYSLERSEAGMGTLAHLYKSLRQRA
ncbi:MULTISPECIES: GNAT family N-acetyltransferase [Haloferax]|uniref:GNAT family N-acetyltransferase n=2 Tax=Haloferax TaxID=2251 RepID=A0A6G1Z7Q0_9EURY|nr:MULTISPECIES: GNAT family N-acetyltransferase [Haloferax]KAB1185156.1 GNAT family N-acetyltransferase [Haloferax sp. CBA1149]MRW82334.1 GNAT family N-acetyltransferase [Haloferax marinisediminis]